MRLYVLLLALLHSLGCTGVPLHNSELQSMADRGLGAAMAEVNSAYAVDRLYRVTRASVAKVIPRGLNSVDLLIPFSVKETECAKTSRTDPQTCAFRPGFFVDVLLKSVNPPSFQPSFSCSTRVRMSSTAAQVITLRCGQDSSSSSSESSEEVFSRGRQQYVPFANRDPAPTAAPVQPGHFFQNQAVDVRPRGDTFSNYLV